MFMESVWLGLKKASMASQLPKHSQTGRLQEASHRLHSIDLTYLLINTFFLAMFSINLLICMPVKQAFMSYQQCKCTYQALGKTRRGSAPQERNLERQMGRPTMKTLQPTTATSKMTQPVTALATKPEH